MLVVRLSIIVKFIPTRLYLFFLFCRLPLGALGLLQVEEPFKRQGLGSLVVRYMSKLLAKQDLEVTAPVIDSNMASRALFKNLGFEIVDEVYWIYKRMPK